MNPTVSSTDPLRRLALQLAIQLPQDLDEARRVMAMTQDLLEDFLDAPSPAQRRAQRLGWGKVCERLAIAADAPAPAPHPLPLARRILLGLASLLLTMPTAAVLLHAVGIGAGLTFMVGVTVVALVLDTGPALVLALATPLLHNLLLAPPVLEFSLPTTLELVAGCGYLVLALLVPWIAARRHRIRAGLIRRPLPAEAPAPVVRLVGSN